MNNFRFLGCCGVLIIVFWGAVATAATVNVAIEDDQVAVGESTQISLFLGLDAGESASVFEGVFNFAGLNSVASVDFTAGGPSWPVRAGNIVGDELRLSLTSANDNTSSRLVATLDVMGLAEGDFSLLFDDSSFAAFDIDVNPFIDNLSLTNLNSETLANVRVVPVPGALLLMLSALGGFSLLSRKHKKQ